MTRRVALPILVAHLSDLHIDHQGDRSPAGVRLARVVADINALVPAVDAVVVTGDLVERGTSEEYRHLAALLAPLQMPFFLIPGNHDSRAALREVLGERQSFARDSEWLQYSVRFKELHIVGLDTLSDGRPEGQLCAARLAWLREVLASAPDVPTVLLMHHPPTDTGIDYMDAMGLLEGAHELAGLLATHPQVQITLCGHVHRPMQLNWRGHAVCIGGSSASQLAFRLATRDVQFASEEPYLYFIHRFFGTSSASHIRFPQSHPVN